MALESPLGTRRPVALTWRDRPVAAPEPIKRTLQPLLRFSAAVPERGAARLLCGDALAAMDRLLGEGATFDLIHLDPPFGSDADYVRRRSVQTSDGKLDVNLPAYGDNDRGDVAGYLESLYPLICRAHQLLKPHGAMYVHIDFRRGPYLRLLLDEIFGSDALLNEIVWAYALGGSSKTRYQRKHDNIFFYVREPGRHYFDAPKEAATSSMLAGKPKLATDTWVTDGADGDATLERDWPDELVRKTMSNRDPERTGYATQKPLALAMRMVTASCPPGGTVFDPMCGSGTIGVAATLLGRNAVLNDRGDAALDVTRARLLAAGGALDVERIDDGPVPQLMDERWAHKTAGGARLNLPASFRDGLQHEGLRGLADTLLHHAVGAWAIGERAKDGALQVSAWSDHANQRNAVPVPQQLAGVKADSWWLADVLAGQSWGALADKPARPESSNT
jgi:DNA modification methylase